MGIKSFFQKIWGGIKKGASKVWNVAKKVGGFIGKIVKPVAKIAPSVLSGMSMLPGKVGIIGKIGAPVMSIVNGLINKMPDGAAKEKLQQISNKGQEAIDTVQNKATNIAQNVSDKAQKWVPFAEHMNGLINGPRPELAVMPHTYRPPPPPQAQPNQAM